MKFKCFMLLIVGVLWGEPCANTLRTPQTSVSLNDKRRIETIRSSIRKRKPIDVDVIREHLRNRCVHFLVVFVPPAARALTHAHFFPALRLRSRLMRSALSFSTAHKTK